MCIFTGAVRKVEGTQIFGRCDGDQQLLAYAMKMESDAAVAMVLPIPVAAAASDDAVRFIDMSGCPQFFVELEQLFPPSFGGYGAPQGFGPAPRPATLKVHDVGSFVASFVPRVADFERLDPQFRLPATVWAALPQLADYGFAVFQLAPGRRAVHPMAFSFPTRHVGSVCFPCVHVHDQAVHPTAAFDHTLYCQTREPGVVPGGAETWSPSIWAPSEAQRTTSRGLLTGAPVHRLELSGELPNADVVASS